MPQSTEFDPSFEASALMGHHFQVQYTVLELSIAHKSFFVIPWKPLLLQHLEIEGSNFLES